MSGNRNFYFTILMLTCTALIQAQDQDEPKGEKLSLRRFFGATTSGFGGSAVKISRIDNRIAILNGGRGAAVFKHHFTFGGGGYRIINRIEMKSGSSDTIHFLKMGYGGLELGYLFLPDYRKLNAGTSFLIGAGAGFFESLPEKHNKSYSIFPVIEPAVFGEAFLSGFLRLHLGVTFRFVPGCQISNVANDNMCGPSAYINLLFGTD